MKIIKLLIMLFVLFGVNVDYSVAVDNNAAKTSAVKNAAKTNAEIDYDDKYRAYSMDGVTSASKLAAQRSHTVAGKDERNFAIFTSITVVLIIYFFSQFEFFDK
ncbi:MAG: hypothetical protein IPN42_09795 [Methylococcaceae bacterium]|nr:hypothetical protein [Methylococcaceae bacterium]